MQMWFSGDQNQLDDPLKRSVGLAACVDRGRGEHQPGPAPDDHGPDDHNAPPPAAADDHTAPQILLAPCRPSWTKMPGRGSR